ncbi:spore cortex-lytic enzyme [Desulfotomaculum nigrificans CO-1-SRB]|uniref:Spore cortex-lytic enzyme n=1 Tax=Desulfotomaculum nigrificans (strain DSM 14880 / VKM B-2319 / CO-1-SRB) TaxID=868595 RepID=F6B670_DESCC|nr:spore cortex-lytic enzyme [Desulfotomaculum nigrificans]AEF95493.1 spore cortex-lytic enzyme [Desulfotomaculum nigrificans CO-1-SRB]
MQRQDKSNRKGKITIFILCLSTLLLGSLMIYNFALAQDPVLYWGTSGDKVYQVQKRLKDWGYYTGPLDGYFGSQMSAAVQKFQRYNGLTADGVVGEQTWQALGLATPAPRNTYTGSSRGFVSNRDAVNLLARVIMGEAADEPYTGKVAVGAVILNRTRHAGFPSTLAGVIYQPSAFESVANGQYNRPLDPEAIRAAQDALAGYDPTGGALYFWNPSKPVSPWIWSRPIVGQIGRHVFAY